MRLLILISVASLCQCKDLVAMGCNRDPSLSFCKIHAAKTMVVNDNEITEKDKEACAELRLEYVKVCALAGDRKVDDKESEFCQAFENICFRIPKNEPDQATVPTALMRELTPIDVDSEENNGRTTTKAPESKKKKRIDFTKFCKEFMNRYLFVCPNPFRFGQKTECQSENAQPQYSLASAFPDLHNRQLPAYVVQRDFCFLMAVVFCPIYSERCHVPLPNRPVVPTRRPPAGRRSSAVERLCRSYRGFAEAYCNNPFTLSQAQYREACERYWRFCTRRNG